MILLPFAKVTISQYNTNKIHFWDIFYLSRDNNNILPISVHQVSLLKNGSNSNGHYENDNRVCTNCYTEKEFISRMDGHTLVFCTYP